MFLCALSLTTALAATPSGAPALGWTGAGLGAAGLTVELWALANDEPTAFALGLSGEIIGLPMVAGSGLWAAGAWRRGGRSVSAVPGLAALGLWTTGLGIKAVWRTRGPDSLGGVSLAVFGAAYASAGLQWWLVTRGAPAPSVVIDDDRVDLAVRFPL